MRRVFRTGLPLLLCMGCSSSSVSNEVASDAGTSPHDAAPGRDGAHADVGVDAGPVTVLSFGPTLVASLTQSGQLTVTDDGKPLLATAGSEPLFSSAVDPGMPTAWHDPKALAGDTFTALPPSAITMDSPSPGILHLTANDTRANVVLVSLALGSDAGFYSGLGERYDHVDPRGEIVGMQLELDPSYESSTTDRHVPVPWLVSSRGYGVFVKNRQAGAWDVASTDAAVVRSTFEGSSLDVTLVVNPDPLAVVATLTTLTGLARATPTWVLGPMMWRHVDNQAELLGDLAHIRSLHIPTTTYWIDDGWQVALNTLDFDPTKYTDAGAAAATMTTLGFKLFGWNSPYLHAPTSGATPDEAQALYPMAASSGYFVEQAGAPFPAPGPGSGSYGLVDFTSASATAFWDMRAAGTVSIGMDGFKLDYGEDLIPSILGARLGVTLSDGETERTARNYPLAYHGAYRAALAAKPDAGDAAVGDDGVLVVRASTYGGGQVADIVWPGDLDNGFQHYGDSSDAGTLLVGGLPASVIAAQTLSVSGFALFGADTGGYRGGSPSKEALLRWAEQTSLSMVMQLGPGENKYPWLYDTDTVTTYTALANLHQSLVPYLASLLAAAETRGTPPIRPLPFAFPTDTTAPMFADTEYLLGPSLLAAPVLVPGVTSRQVYLPAGTWFPWWGGAALTGPMTFTAEAPIGQPPLYVLAGTLLPLLPAGIDTLVASNDPSTVSLTAMEGTDVASAWVSGTAGATCLDGSTIALTDENAGVGVTWSPSGTGNVLTVTLDLSQRKGNRTMVTGVVAVSGTPPVAVGSADAVTSSSVSAYYLDGTQAIVRLAGPASVRVE